LTPGVRYHSFWLEYNEPATKDAEKKTRALISAPWLSPTSRQSVASFLTRRADVEVGG
jgi:hypothetical protein